MKYYIFCISVLIATFSFSQPSEEEAVEQTIETFFEGFHKQDGAMVLSTVHSEIKMQSISSNSDNKTALTTSSFTDFLRSIASIPKEKTFKEEILDYIIQIDGNMASVWTPYNFYLNGNFSHCGVNSFQLFKDNGKWKIIYIVDTRRKECREN
ncbi:nuclear transport factor 2 family protein [Psychroserpens sp. Hel_I_66]|uniref:nuclear transport factor 2 family protein n=1 Tax=Psychroserpens sp. Hel_I_66 TaxID=1250004 RepID=UPI0006460C0D|nr:nuclear transport factor 2 family protein [Psychroserpens sp. Hel_I_66]